MFNRYTHFLFCLLGPWLSLTLSAQTIFYPGDLAVLGLASNVGGDFGNCTPDGTGQFPGRDRISFIAFKDIEPGTVIDITDNGWERESAGLWGNTEGFIRVTRTGNTIPAGTLITFEFPPTENGYLAVSPDADWQFDILGTNALNFNDGGDQIYFLQGGIWDNGTVLGCCNGEQDASYTGGRILFGFNSRSGWNAFLGDSQHSGLHPDLVPCFNMAPTSGVTSFTSYSGPMMEATQLEWISRIGNPANWTAYPDCDSYVDPPASLPIGPSGMFIDCTVCQACEPFSDTLFFSLPLTGGPFVVNYTDGQDTFELTNVNPDTLLPVMVSSSISYELVRVTNASGCPVYSNFESGADLQVQSNPPVLTCMPTAPAPNGSAVFSLSGGTGPYTIQWQDPRGIGGSISGDGSAGITVSGLLVSGEYEATLTDAAGCTDSCTFMLDGPDCNLTLELEGTDPACGDPVSGRITATINGAQGEVIYSWNDNGFVGPQLSGLSAGPYSLTVVDEAGCLDSARLELIMPASLDIDLELINQGMCDGIQTVLINGVSGGEPPYNVRIDPSAPELPLVDLPMMIPDLIPGNYNFILEDNVGCQMPFNVVIPENTGGAGLILDLGGPFSVQAGQSVRTDPFLNFVPVEVNWSPETFVDDPNSLSTTIRPERTTSYTVTATDADGCAVTAGILINVINQEKIFIPSAFSPNEDGVNDRFVLFPGPEIAEILSFRVFDRWGSLVFDSGPAAPGNQFGWDGLLSGGRKAAAGIYLYFTTFRHQDGSERTIKGSVTLIR